MNGSLDIPLLSVDFRRTDLFDDLPVVSPVSSSFSPVHLCFVTSESSQKAQVIRSFQTASNDESHPESSGLS
jgi:hypothetical protein